MDKSQVQNRSGRKRLSLKIALLYAVIGALWIFFSDRAAMMLFITPEDLTRFSMIKGLLYVLLTALLLYNLINHNINRLEASKEEYLRAKEDWKYTFDAVPDLIAIMDDNYRIVRINKAMAMKLGMTSQECTGLKCYQVVHGTDVPAPFCMNSQLLDDKSEHTMEVWLDRLGGHFIVSVSPLFDPEGNLKGRVHVARDITERKQAEEALSEKHRQLEETVEELARARNMLQLIVESIPVRVFWKDRNSRYLGCNSLFARDAGLSRPEELLGKDDFAMKWAEQAELYTADDREVMESGISKFNIVEPQTTPSGSRIWLNTSKVPLRSPGGEVFGILGVYEDITGRKQAEEERLRLEERLQRAEKMEALGTMAGGVAHDLNNVLGIVVGYAELLLLNVDVSGPARCKAEQILKAGQRAAAIVQDLLTLARRGVAGRKVLNLNNLLLECRKSPEFAQALSIHPNILFKTDLEADLLNVLGSSVHLGKTFINLVSNAAEAMPNGGVLTVKTANCYLDKPISGYDEVREGDYVVLSIADTGEGIPASDLKRIFEPFYTKKTMGRSGTGLGLAVVWGTVKDHLGYINVESTEGQGTTFTLYFPVTRDETAPEHVAVSAAEYLGNEESILVVDDVKEQRELACDMIRKLNYQVESVPSGEEAVERLRGRTVDLVILDMIMDPGMDGLDTFRKILEVHPRQKAIIVSGFAETDRVREAQSLGAGAYVKKPYVLEKLGLAIRRELDRP